MILNFDKFQKVNQNGGELNKIRIKNLNIFKEKGFLNIATDWKKQFLDEILNINLLSI